MIGRLFGFIGEHIDRLITIAYPPPTNQHKLLLVVAEEDRDVFEPLTSAATPSAERPDPATPCAGSGHPIRSDSELFDEAANIIWCLALDEGQMEAEWLHQLVRDLRDRAAQFKAIE